MDVYIYNSSGEAIYKAVIPKTEETAEECASYNASMEAYASMEASENAYFRETVLNSFDTVLGNTEMIAIGILLFATLHFILNELHWWR